MTQIELRNTVIASLSSNAPFPVILYQPDAKAPPGDYFHYIIVNPYIPYGQGVHKNTAVASAEPEFSFDIKHERIEQATAVFRFVSVSDNADQAEKMAEDLQSFFLHGGTLDLYLKGVVCVDAQNPQDVTMYDIDRTKRMWSTDVTFRYTRIDSRTDPNIEHIHFSQE